MNFSDLIQQRFSARKYLNKPVEPEKITRCLEAARLAPSASNSQPWRFIVVNNPGLKEKVAAETYSTLLTFNKFVHQAPVIVVFVIESPKLITQIGGRIKNKEYSLIDIGIAAEHFCLQATEEGLGTCMLGWYNEKAIKTLLNIPASRTIGLLVTLGYPDYETVPSKKRKTFESLVSYNSY
ncbi:MAG: nitroreductase family protein [Bacteroidales bacterium]|nr:nitroreductase family protein [Bacteroidales bacterium]